MMCETFVADTRWGRLSEEAVLDKDPDVFYPFSRDRKGGSVWNEREL